MAIDSETKSEYLKYLPASFAADPFIGRFLLAFQQILSGLEGAESEPKRGLQEIIAGIANIFSPNNEPPDNTPLEFLPWLASWVALSLRNDWTEEEQRKFLAEIVPLYRERGTAKNLAELLAIYTGLNPPPEVIEPKDTPFQIRPFIITNDKGEGLQIGVNTRIGGTVPHYFRVSVTINEPDPTALGRQSQIVVALIELQKPVHTVYDLDIFYVTMQIRPIEMIDGKWEGLQIGNNTLIGKAPLPS